MDTKGNRWDLTHCVRGVLCVLSVCAALALPVSPLEAHDLERTQVVLSFARDGSFVIDVRNDPNWLKLRLESFKGPFADRVVLWVDGREVRPVSTEYIGGELDTHRLRGRVPIDARTLRWYYGLVIDPYPLVVRRADGRVLVEEIGGDAWSSSIDLTGQFQGTSRWPIAIVALLFAAGVSIRLISLK